MDGFTKDKLILEAILIDDTMVKSAQSGIFEGLFNKTKEYAKEQIKEDDKLGSIVDLLAPGILWASGFKTISIILEVAQHWFGFSISKIFEEIATSIRSALTGNKQISSDNVEHIVSQAVQNNSGKEPTQEDLDKAQHYQITAELELEDVILYKTAIKQLSGQNIIKHAGLLQFIGLRGTTGSILIKVIKWAVMAVLAAGGFLVATNAVDSVLGIGPKSKEPSDQSSQAISLKSSTQSLLKVNPSYEEEKYNLTSHWIETVPPSQIGNDILQWAKEIYPDLNNEDTTIENSSGFNQVVHLIQNYNRTNTTDITFIPKSFTSKKEVVDQFIDEVASKLQNKLTSNPSQMQQIPLAQPKQSPKISEPF